jgi:hypothetical protein
MSTLNNSLCVRPVSSLTPSPIAWLWPLRFGLGKVILLDGDPGLGKSLVALDFCARLSAGQHFPCSTAPVEPANSLVINGEDGQNDSIAPRLEALGANLNRVFVLHREGAGNLVLRLPSNIEDLDGCLKQTAAKLLVIDPVVAFLDANIQVASDAGIRQALAPLAELARKHNCVILLIRHLNKTASHHAMYRGGGSIGFQGACRSSWLLVADPLDGSCRVLAQVKNNDAPKQPSLLLQVVVAAGVTPTLRWLGEHPWTADQLLRAGAHPPKVAVALERAKRFVLDFLQSGPRTSREIWQAGKLQKLTPWTLRKAREELAIAFKSLYVDGERTTYWLLPGQKLAPEVAANCAELDLEPWLAPQRERFPPPCPLDRP